MKRNCFSRLVFGTIIPICLTMLLGCAITNTPILTQFNQYFITFTELVEKMNEFQKVYEENEKFMFEISNNYSYKTTYGIKGVCYCPLATENHTSHKEGEKCPNFRYRQPYYKLSGGEAVKDVYVHYLDEIEFDASSLYWDSFLRVPDPNADVSFPNQYTLKDKNGSKVVKVECFDDFSKKDNLLSDIINLLNKSICKEDL